MPYWLVSVPAFTGTIPVPAAGLFSGPFHVMAQPGLRKMLDTSFMIATMAYGNADIDYVEKYFSAWCKPISTSGKNLEHNTIATNSRNIVVTRWTLDDPEQANELRLNPVLAS